MLMRAGGISSGVLLERGADDIASFLRAAHMGAQEKRPPREGRGSHFPPRTGYVMLCYVMLCYVMLCGTREAIAIEQ